MNIDLQQLEQRNRELHKKLRELEDLRDSIKKIIIELTPLGITDFSQIAMPLVAKSFPALVMNDLIGVQPICASPALKYALKHRYGDQKWSDHINLPTIDEPPDVKIDNTKVNKVPSFITDKKKAKLVRELLRNEQKWLSLHDL